MAPKLTQIMPAQGWYAVYGHDEHGNERWNLRPLVAWALAEDSSVRGLTAHPETGVVDDASAVDSFEGYHNDGGEVTWARGVEWAMQNFGPRRSAGGEKSQDYVDGWARGGSFMAEALKSETPRRGKVRGED